MRHVQTEKQYYKMYKKGRFWVFAGITVATIGISPIIGRADQENKVSTQSTTSAAMTNQASVATGKTVVLNKQNEQGASQAQTDETSTKGESTTSAENQQSKNVTDSRNNTSGSATGRVAMKTDTSLTNDNAHAQSNATDTQMPGTSTANQSATQPTSSHAQASITNPANDTQQATVNGKQTTVATTETKADTTTTTDEKNITTANTEPDAASPTTSTDSVVNPAATAKTTDTSADASSTTNTTDATINAATTLTESEAATNQTRTNTESTVQDDSSTVPTAAKMSRAVLRSVQPATVTSSGTIGTSAWTMTDDGVLTIGAGDWSNADVGSLVGNFGKQLTQVVIDGKVNAGDDLSWLFFSTSNLKTIQGFENLDTSKVTDFSHMFTNTAISDFSGIANWDVSAGTGFNSMFANNKSLQTIDLSHWQLNQTKPVNLFMMFNSDTALTTIDLSAWDTRMVTNIGGMFAGAASGTMQLKSVDLHGWQLPNVTSMGSMFIYDDQLTHVDLSGWQTSAKLTDMNYMFQGTSKLTTLDLSALDMRSATMTKMLINQDNRQNPVPFNLQQLTLSATSKLTGSMLPAIPTGTGYSGYWVNQVDATQRYDSASLMALYNGTANPTATTTWVWETAPSQSELTAADVTGLIAGPNTTWKLADSVATLKDVTGVDISANVDELVKVLSVNGDTAVTTVDAQTAGTYQVTLQYIDGYGVKHEATSTIVIAPNQTKLVGRAVTIKMGPHAAYQLSDLIDATQSLNAAGQQLSAAEIDRITVSGLDMNQPGTQQVTLAFTDDTGQRHTTEVPVTMIASQATLAVKDSTIGIGPNQTSWDFHDYLTHITDFDGQVIAPEQWDALNIVADKQPDLKTSGTQLITVTYTDALDNVHTATTTVNVVASAATLKSQPAVIVFADKAAQVSAKTLVTELTDVTGTALTDTSAVTMQGFDAKTSGPQTVTLTYTDAYGNVLTTQSVVTVDFATISGKNTTLIAGPTATWNYIDNIEALTDSNGQTIDAQQAKLSYDQPNLTSAMVGVPQSITLTYTDDLGQIQQVTVVVTTQASKASITAKADQVIWPHEVTNLKATDLVANVQDATGQPLTNLAAGQLTMSPITADRAGAQLVTLTFMDEVGNLKTAQLKVTVDQATITTQPTTVIAGPTATWQYLAAIQQVSDGMGQSIEATNANIQLLNHPDLSTAKIGQPQTVQFRYLDSLGQQHIGQFDATTVASQAVLVGQPVSLIAGPQTSWQLDDSIDGAHSLAANGQALTAAQLKQVTTDSLPDLSKPGTYQLTLRYLDEAGNLVTGQTIVTVAASQAAIQVRDSQLTVGTAWQAADNLVQAVDATGHALALTDLTVTGKVDTQTAGRYQITYAYTDAVGNAISETALITVVAPPVDPDENGNGDEVKPDEPDSDGGQTKPGDNNSDQPKPDDGADNTKPGTGDTDSSKPDNDTDDTKPNTGTTNPGGNDQETSTQPDVIPDDQSTHETTQPETNHPGQTSASRPGRSRPTATVRPAKTTQHHSNGGGTAKTLVRSAKADAIAQNATANVTSTNSTRSAKSSATEASNRHGQLPQTSEANASASVGAVVLGLVGLLGLSGLAAWRRHFEHED
ncbi:BspA family leucine-rich repeat surface protein [Lactiplantibacillus pentosus]|uniref:BspA family leucine-rich repeat surface protein n=1 Tax=Lactiplantibacillus pentosus TaxID=1589 RepID=UPI0021A5F437|nr:BspA family leucine-rich repeat surface protein [Lactiplantibacillus pentosus]MCT3288010.1 BspA family leucine-rich repeat surface protein [Lactiplantibacillus pentosus]